MPGIDRQITCAFDTFMPEQSSNICDICHIGSWADCLLAVVVPRPTQPFIPLGSGPAFADKAGLGAQAGTVHSIRG